MDPLALIVQRILLEPSRTERRYAWEDLRTWQAGGGFMPTISEIGNAYAKRTGRRLAGVQEAMLRRRGLTD